MVRAELVRASHAGKIVDVARLALFRIEVRIEVHDDGHTDAPVQTFHSVEVFPGSEKDPAFHDATIRTVGSDGHAGFIDPSLSDGVIDRIETVVIRNDDRIFRHRNDRIHRLTSGRHANGIEYDWLRWFVTVRWHHGFGRIGGRIARWRITR